jgi:positive regulator of sigma E activity
MSPDMLERQGRVVVVGADSVTIRFARESGCSLCRASTVCAGSATERDLDVPLPAGAPRPQAGEMVSIGVPEGVALRATFQLYLTPLGGLGMGMALATLAGLPEGGIAAAAFGGLAIGLALIRRVTRNTTQHLKPELLLPDSCGNTDH